MSFPAYAAPGRVEPMLLAALRFAAACVVGGVLIHVAEFHLGLGVNGTLQERLSVARFMILHCPLRFWVVLASVCAVGMFAVGVTPLRRDLRSLRGSRPDKRIQVAGARFREPVRPVFVAGLCSALSGAQLLIFTLAMDAETMTYVMKMQGTRMVMSMHPPLPVVPLCLAVGVIGGLILALLQRRIRIIAAIVAALVRISRSVPRSIVFTPVSIQRPPLWRLLGPALFSRPPPGLVLSQPRRRIWV